MNPSFSLFVSLQALFPAASRLKRGSANVMELMFHNSFEDVHLLFEVKPKSFFREYYRQNQDTDFFSLFFVCFSSSRFSWLVPSLRTMESFLCETLSWHPSARQGTWKSSVKRSFPGTTQTYYSSSMASRIKMDRWSRTILNAPWWPWYTPPSRWSTPPVNTNEECGRSRLLICTKPSNRTWRRRDEKIPLPHKCIPNMRIQETLCLCRSNKSYKCLD